MHLLKFQVAHAAVELFANRMQAIQASNLAKSASKALGQSQAFASFSNPISPDHAAISKLDHAKLALSKTGVVLKNRASVRPVNSARMQRSDELRSQPQTSTAGASTARNTAGVGLLPTNQKEANPAAQAMLEANAVLLSGGGASEVIASWGRQTQFAVTASALASVFPTSMAVALARRAEVKQHFANDIFPCRGACFYS